MTFLGKENAKKVFTIPGTWKVYSPIKIQADSLAEAMEWAKEYFDDDPSYEIGEYELAIAMNQEPDYEM